MADENTGIETLSTSQKKRSSRNEDQEDIEEFNSTGEATALFRAFNSILEPESVALPGDGTANLDDIRAQIENRSNVDLGDVINTIEGLPGEELIDSIQSVEGYLEVIARAAVAQAKLQQVTATSSVAQLATLETIRREVSSFSRIRVSGTNIIDEPNSPEQVVPGAETEDIPTQILFIQASQDNQEPIYFGDDNVEPEIGFRLDQGEFITLEINLNGEVLYMASQQEGAEIQLLGLS